MEISRFFLDILQSIDYHVGHLPKDLFANEAQLPELLPIFTWFIDNVTPKSNCVTPKELALYASKASWHNHSLEKISLAIDKFYNESTKKSKLCSSDLESIKKKILKSEQELIDLNVYETLYKNKIKLINEEISLLEQNKSHKNKKFNEIEINLNTITNTFNERIDRFDSNVTKLYYSVFSVNNENVCLPKLALNNLINLTNVWREKILNMIKTNNLTQEPFSNCTEEKYALQIPILFQSITDLSLTEMNIKYDIVKLNTAINNITNYLLKNINNQEIPIERPELIELENFHSIIVDVIANSKNKIWNLETINDNLTFILDSIEYYVIMHDVIYVLMMTYGSIANLKCELILHSKNVLEKILNTITFDYQNAIAQGNTNVESNIIRSSHTKDVDISFSTNEFNKLDVFKQNSRIYTTRCSDEVENLSKTVQQWKNKYHFSRNECTKLITLQSKLQLYINKLN